MNKPVKPSTVDTEVESKLSDSSGKAIKKSGSKSAENLEKRTSSRVTVKPVTYFPSKKLTQKHTTFSASSPSVVEFNKEDSPKSIAKSSPVDNDDDFRDTVDSPKLLKSPNRVEINETISPKRSPFLQSFLNIVKVVTSSPQLYSPSQVIQQNVHELPPSIVRVNEEPELTTQHIEVQLDQENDYAIGINIAAENILSDSSVDLGINIDDNSGLVNNAVNLENLDNNIAETDSSDSDTSDVENLADEQNAVLAAVPVAPLAPAAAIVIEPEYEMESSAHPQTFSGLRAEDSHRWTEKVELWLTTKGPALTNRQKIAHASGLLRGAAEDYFHSIDLDGIGAGPDDGHGAHADVEVTWQAFKTLLRNKYPVVEQIRIACITAL